MLACPEPPDEVADPEGEEETLATGAPPEPELPQAAANSPHTSGPAIKTASRCIMASSFIDQSCPPLIGGRRFRRRFNSQRLTSGTAAKPVGASRARGGAGDRRPRGAGRHRRRRPALSPSGR